MKLKHSTGPNSPKWNRIIIYMVALLIAVAGIVSIPAFALATTDAAPETTIVEDVPAEETNTEEANTDETTVETPASDEGQTTLYDQLMAAESAEEMDELLANATEEDAASLTSEQLTALTELVNSFEDSDTKTSVLATLDGLTSDENKTETVADATVTVEQGGSVTISDANDHDEWRVVDSSGSAVSNISVSRNYNGTLTVSVGSNVTPGNYVIQYRDGEWVHEGFLDWRYEYSEWGSSGYTVQVTQAQGYQPHTNGQTITKGNGGSGSGTTTEPTPSISKSATKYDGDNNYTYDLALTVSSTVGSTESKVAVDLLFIIDRSGSMGRGDGSSVYTNMLSATKTAVKSLVTSLSQNENLDMRYAVVTFSGSKGGRESNYDDAWTTQDWTSDASTVNSSVEGITANGGTNYEAGLVQGHDVLTSARAEAYKYVIFLSDGVPTFHYNKAGRTVGDGNETSDEDDTHAQAAAKTLVGVNGFYTVYANKNTSGSTYLNNLTSALKSADSTVSTDNITTTSGSDLSSIFANFAKQFTEVACTKVSVSDTLSEWVVPTTGASPYVVIKVENDDGTTTTYSSKDGNIPEAEQGIDASYDSDSKQLKLNFPKDYELKEDYTYEVHIDIEPTEAAEAKGTSGYDLTADANTGTHAGTLGYKSNAENSAKLTYTVNNAERNKDYPKPVVQVPSTGSLAISKTVSGDESKVDTHFDFVLSAKDKSGAQLSGGYSVIYTGVVKSTDTTSHPETITFDDGTASLSLKNDEEATITGLPDGAVVTVSETGATASNLTVSVGGTSLTPSEEGVAAADPKTIEASKTASVAFANTYQLYNLQVKKQDSSGTALSGAVFTLTPCSSDGTKTSGADALTSSAEATVAGTVQISGLEPGYYLLEETYVPAGYQKLDGMYVIYVDGSNGGSATLTLKGSETSGGSVNTGDLSKVQGADDTFTMTVTDAGISHLPSTGGPGNGLLYALGVGLIAGAVVLVAKMRGQVR